MKKITGKIVSDKMTGSAVVVVSRWSVHPLYKKRFLRHKKYHTDNSIGAKLGDAVRLVPSRPLSKTKRWKIAEVLKGKGALK